MRKSMAFLLVSFIILTLLTGCGQPTKTEIKQMLIALSYDYYQEFYDADSEQISSEFNRLITGIDSSLIGGYDVDEYEFIIDMNRFARINEEGKFFLKEVGEENLKSILTESYEELLDLLKNEQWDKEDQINSIFDKLKLASYIGFTSFTHIDVLEAYFDLEIYNQRGDDLLVSSALKKIPDDYTGPLATQILLSKRTIAPTSEAYIRSLAVEEIARERKELQAIEFTEFNYKIERNYARISGKIKNNLDTSISYVKVEVVYRIEEGGQIVDSDWTYAVGSHSLRPGYTTSFSLMTPYSEGMNYANIEVVSFQKE